MAVSRRRLLRSMIWAPSNCSMGSPAIVAPLSACARIAVHRLQGARHLQVREHRPHSVLLCRHSCG